MRFLLTAWWYNGLIACLQSFHDYYSRNHSRLLAVWRTVVGFRRQFTEAKSSMERDMAQVHSEVSRVSRDVQSVCVSFSTSLHNAESQKHVGYV